MTTTINSQGVAVVALPAGKRISIVMAASSTGIAQRLQGEAQLDVAGLTASQTLVLGEYLVDVVVKISCLTGSLAYEVTQNTGPRATQTNDDAATGQIGEYLESTVAIGSAVPETTATPVDVASLALTAGDWDVSGTVSRVLTGTTATQYAAAISPTANTVPAQAGGSGVAADSSVTQDAAFGATVTGNFVTAISPVRVKLAVAATIHLVAADTFSAGTIGLFGTLRARRVR